jgi:hypothetical protein
MNIGLKILMYVGLTLLMIILVPILLGVVALTIPVSIVIGFIVGILSWFGIHLIKKDKETPHTPTRTPRLTSPSRTPYRDSPNPPRSSRK